MKKVTKVEFEYEDGTKSKLIGDEAERWNQAMKDVMFCYQNHGNTFPKFEWV